MNKFKVGDEVVVTDIVGCNKLLCGLKGKLGIVKDIRKGNRYPVVVSFGGDYHYFTKNGFWFRKDSPLYEEDNGKLVHPTSFEGNV